MASPDFGITKPYKRKEGIMPKRIIKTLFVLALIMLTFCSVVMSSDLSNAVSAVYNFDFKNITDLRIAKGYDIFIKDESLYALALEWKHEKKIYESHLLIKKKGNEEWTSVDIPGKAYYLGEGYNNEICTIEHDKEKKIWHISFYDLDGKKLREIEHKYKTFYREYYHYEPVPLCYEDGSLVFYTIYEYEARNIVSKIFLDLISGGHGSKGVFGEYIEIVPDLINKESKRKSFPYARVIDSSGLRRAFPLNKDIPLFDSTKKRNFSAGDYQITAYEMDDEDNNYYFNNNMLIKASDKIEIIDITNGGRTILPMPPDISNIFVYDYDKFKFDGFTNRHSDVWAESGDVFLALRVLVRNKAIIVTYFYDGKKKQWSKNSFDFGNENYRQITIYKKDEYLYMGLGGGLSKN